MLFNSYIFIFVFLPVVWVIWFFLNRLNRLNLAIGFLVLASIVFYSYWNPKYTILLLVSMYFNFILSMEISQSRNHKKALLILGLSFNLLVLGYFKYCTFIFNEIFNLLDADLELEKIALPLGISFFTFQKIAYLVDSYKGKIKEFNFLRYTLFVMFFPQLIAGPIVHHSEVIPQFKRFDNKITENLSIGVTLFIIGLFKKVCIADLFGSEATQVFKAVNDNHNYMPNFIDSWCAALFYTFQIYFDFSGYSDMAVGLGRMFGIKLPINFASPYKSTSIIEFWRRWHITLSRFLKDYIYIPLGGSRMGKNRQLANIFITMLLGGIWHGASWMMVIWGLIHAALLVINRLLRWKVSLPDSEWLKRVLVFILLVFTWVPFRSESVYVMKTIYAGMLGFHDVFIYDFIKVNTNLAAIGIPSMIIILWFTPNSYEWLQRYSPALPTKGYSHTEIKINKEDVCWQPRLVFSLILSFMLFLSLVRLNDASEFIYFQF